MLSKVRINANIDRHKYEEFQKALKARRKTITEFVDESITRFICEETYAQDKQAFDNLACEMATKEMLAIDKECSHDGL